MGAGILIFLIPVMALILSLLEIVQISGDNRGYFYWGFLAVALSMSVSLARNFARTNRNLQTRLIEVQELSEKTLSQERRLRDEEVRRQLLEGELSIAHDLQMSLMPDRASSQEGIDIAGYCVPASHVGGDFFQYYAPAPDRVAISLADVTGHGMEAAVPVMMFSGILETEMRLGDPLEELFANLNSTLLRKLDRRTFICLAVGEVDVSSSVLRLVNGGCPYPYLYRAESDEILELEAETQPLGIRANAAFQTIEVQLQPHDRVVFYSDGITEAVNPEGQPFGYEQAAESIRRACRDGLDSQALLKRVIAEVRNFAGQAPQEDDMTIVALRVEP